METISPPPLQPGDKVALISTARKVPEAAIDKAVELIKSWSYEPVEGAHLRSVDRQYAGTDSERRADLQWALDHQDIRAVICMRGGYGTARIIDDLDLDGLRFSPKWVAGYSDVCALHHHLYTQLGLQSLHSSMPVNFAENSSEALESLRLQLGGNWVNSIAAVHRLNREGSAEGNLIGGNLSVLYSQMGSRSELSTEGAILILEDLDEYLYHIDRMMLALRRAGKLQKLAGLVVGGMTEMRDNPVPFGKNAEEIIAEHCEPYSFPLAFNLPSGHIADNRCWVHGKKVRLTVKNDQPSSLNHC